MRTIILIALSLLLVSCAVSPKEEVQTYKISLGKKCTTDNKVYSFLWFETVYGESGVSNKNCKKK